MTRTIISRWCKSAAYSGQSNKSDGLHEPLYTRKADIDTQFDEYYVINAPMTIWDKSQTINTKSLIILYKGNDPTFKIKKGSHRVANGLTKIT